MIGARLGELDIDQVHLANEDLDEVSKQWRFSKIQDVGKRCCLTECDFRPVWDSNIKFLRGKKEDCLCGLILMM